MKESTRFTALILDGLCLSGEIPMGAFYQRAVESGRRLGTFRRYHSVSCLIYLFILSYGMEPEGYGLKMRKKAKKEKQ
jgi:hypothetical protein